MKRFPDKNNCFYDLTELPQSISLINPPKPGPDWDKLPTGIKWGNTDQPPKIGSRVKINFNQLGTGTVESYFVEHDWLGLCVKLDKSPEWKIKQQKENFDVALVFAIDIKEL